MASELRSPVPTFSPLSPLGIGPDSRPLVVGLGKTGLSIARFLAAQGIKLAVADSRDRPPEVAHLAEALPDVAVFLGGFDAAVFAAATHLIVSPGVPLETAPIAQARQRGVPVFGDVDLFACFAKAPVIAITGANGKSTVTTLLGLMAEADGRKVRVGGNLGTPMLDLLDPAADLYVLELSSFQTERASLLEPTAATVLNISPDHMDRYPDLESYARAKQRVFAGKGTMVLNADDPRVAAMAEPGREVLYFGVEASGRKPEFGLGTRDGQQWLMVRETPLIPAGEVRIKGRHNLANALAAVALGQAAGLSETAMIKALRQFPGLDHRMQWVAEIGGVAYINDSKATNVGACMAALEGLEGKVVLIAGGDGKGADFSVLAPVAARSLRAAVLTGRDAPLLEAVLAPLVPTVHAEHMREAVQAARQLAKAGDTVLLAPACASLDQYRDYQERGRIFTECVKGLAP